MGTAISVFEPIKNNRTFEEVSTRIKKMIFDGVFKPGDKLPPETQLAKQFDVGRQSVREALRILEISGFITITKGGGGGSIIKDTISNTISSLFLDAFHLKKMSLEELTVARVEIEKVVLNHAIDNADESDFKRLKNNVAITKKKIANNLIVLDENIQFHQLIARASKNHLFIIVIEAITTAVRHSMTQLRPDANLTAEGVGYSDQVLQSKNALGYHEAILNAMLDKNRQLATEMLEKHLLEVKSRLQTLVDRDT